MNEIWHPVDSWLGLYEVSNLGRVRSVVRMAETTFGLRRYGGKVVSTFVGSRGYLCVTMTGSGKRKQNLVHKLVLESFVGPRPNGMQCCHRNGDRTDASLENLRWDTVSANHADKKLHGTNLEKESHPNAKLTTAQVLQIRGQAACKPEVLATIYGVSAGYVRDIRSGRARKYG